MKYLITAIVITAITATTAQAQLGRSTGSPAPIRPSFSGSFSSTIAPVRLGFTGVKTFVDKGVHNTVSYHNGKVVSVVQKLVPLSR